MQPLPTDTSVRAYVPTCLHASVVSVVRQIIAKFSRNRSNCDASMKPGTFTLQIPLFKKSTGATQNSKMAAPKSKMSAKTLCHTYLQHNIILCTACFTFVHFIALSFRASMRGSVVSVVQQIIAKFSRNRSNCDTSMKPGTFTLQIPLFKKSTGAT